VDSRHAKGYRIWLKFAVVLEGEIDLTDVLWGPVFEPLKYVSEFAKLRADKELETLVWANGADLAPESLYERVKRAKLTAAE